MHHINLPYQHRSTFYTVAYDGGVVFVILSDLSIDRPGYCVIEERGARPVLSPLEIQGSSILG